MPTYVIGDVQGCFVELQALLNKIEFNENKDTLWFAGDLVNRGPQSLEVLRFVKGLGDKQVSVLGNHDLTLLAIAYGARETHAGNTLDDVLSAPDRDELIDWLRHLPLIHHDSSLNYTMSHAGIAPAWTLEQALSLSKEVELALQHSDPYLFLSRMYGNEPEQWEESLLGMPRLRCIVNYFTRMRFCYADGRLDLNYKGQIEGKPAELVPWFDVADRKNKDLKIIFGHWAALNGQADVPNVFPMDTGCIWGNCLTAMRLEDGLRFAVKCR